MKERIFIISPLPETEEEEQIPYNKNGNTIATPYYDERGNTIEPAYQEQPEPAPTIEKHITIIYEAAKPKVIIQEDLTAPAEPNIPNPQKVTTIFPSQPETPTAQDYPRLQEYLNGNISYARLLAYTEGQSLDAYLAEQPSAGAYPRFGAYINNQSLAEYTTQIQQPEIYEPRITYIREQLAEICRTTSAGILEPIGVTQAGEIQAAA